MLIKHHKEQDAMSTILCDEQTCVYQKDGICNLDSVNTQKIPKNPSSCVYFSSAADVSLKNEAQNQQEH